MGAAPKFVVSGEKRATTGRQQGRSPGNGIASGSSDGLLPEPAFLRTLSLERKRAERSKKSFVLALLDLEELSRNDNALVGKAISAVIASIRETDSPGWFKTNCVLGIIFAELGAASRHSVLAALNARIETSLRAALRSKHGGHVRLSLYYFPEDGKEAENNPEVISPLYPDLVQRERAKRVPLIIKRIMDIVGASLGLIVLSPVFLVIAFAIKLTSSGPVLFRQERIGRYGKKFTFLKFRSMYCSNDPGMHREYVQRFIAGKEDSAAAEPSKAVVYKITQDPRVTPVGKFLRKTSLDELPQFFNVLKGEMSLVGPRPPLAYELAAYGVWHRRRLWEAKPGITGLWQVNGRSRLRFDDMVRLDLRYARTWSVWLDIEILLRTPRAVFSGEGAY